MLGFDDILILSNDCIDGSPKLLDELAKRGHVRHIQHFPKPNTPPLKSAYKLALSDPILRSSDWVMPMDIDEFLQIFIGDGSIHELIEQNAQHCLGMAIHWKVFGNNNQIEWSDKFVRHQFIMSAPSISPQNTSYKSIFRDMAHFGQIRSHTPRNFSKEWGGRNIWVDSSGEPLRFLKLLDNPKHSIATSQKRITHKAAQINHYAVKSQEGINLKATQKSGARLIQRHNDDFYQRYNCNDEMDLSALTREDEFRYHYEAIRQDSEIMRLHHLCCANYISRLCEVAQKDHKSDQRYIYHKDLSES